MQTYNATQLFSLQKKTKNYSEDKNIETKLRHHHLPNNSVTSFFCTHPLYSFSDRSDEGLTLETSALKLFTVANLRYQLS